MGFFSLTDLVSVGAFRGAQDAFAYTVCVRAGNNAIVVQFLYNSYLSSLGGLFPGGGDDPPSKSLVEIVVDEFGDELLASSGQSASARAISVSGLTIGEFDDLKEAALSYIVAAGQSKSQALDKILDAMIKGVAEKLASEDLNASKILAVAAQSAVKSAAASERDALVSDAALKTEDVIASITAVAVRQAETVCANKAAARELKAAIVREAVAAIDSAVTVTADESAGAINKIVGKVVEAAAVAVIASDSGLKAELLRGIAAELSSVDPEAGEAIATAITNANTGDNAVSVDVSDVISETSPTVTLGASLTSVNAATKVSLMASAR